MAFCLGFNPAYVFFFLNVFSLQAENHPTSPKIPPGRRVIFQGSFISYESALSKTFNPLDDGGAPPQRKEFLECSYDEAKRGGLGRGVGLKLVCSWLAGFLVFFFFKYFLILGRVEGCGRT